MEPRPGSPTVRRRRLAAELRRLREDKGLTGDEVAAALRWSPSKISRYELARTGLKPAEVKKLLDVYGVQGRHREQLLMLAQEATGKGWWEDYADALAPQYLEFIGMEAEASSVLQWAADVVPGLLQTEDYARQIHLGYQRVVQTPPRILERRVNARLIRQQVLTRDPPLELSVVLDEAALLRRFGSRATMRGQLERLLELSRLPSVTLRVRPLAAEHWIAATSFVIFRFGPEHETTLHDVVTSEHIHDEIYVEDEEETYQVRLAFEQLTMESLDPAESRELIGRIACQWQ